MELPTPGDIATGTWAPSVSSVYAVGPHTVDPRTGEILDADIMFAHSWIHVRRRVRTQDHRSRPRYLAAAAVLISTIEPVP